MAIHSATAPVLLVEMVKSVSSASPIHLQVASPIKWDQGRLISSDHRWEASTIEMAACKGDSSPPWEGRAYQSRNSQDGNIDVGQTTRKARHTTGTIHIESWSTIITNSVVDGGRNVQNCAKSLTQPSSRIDSSHGSSSIKLAQAPHAIVHARANHNSHHHLASLARDFRIPASVRLARPSLSPVSTAADSRSNVEVQSVFLSSS